MKAVPRAALTDDLLGSYLVGLSVCSMVFAWAVMMVGPMVDTRAGKTAASLVAMMAKVMDDVSESRTEVKTAAYSGWKTAVVREC